MDKPLGSTRASEKKSRRLSIPPLDLLFGTYGFLLLLFLVVRYGIADRTTWSFALNSLFQHSFWPVLILLPLAIVCPTKISVVVVGSSILIFLWHWGGLFVPKYCSATGWTNPSRHDLQYA